ncbi:MAG: phosphate signaling complex protein PhoU [Geovibrio sp.]|uniref:phosphate signaling complex protein PhoU n=1 Tax=Geovibrio ferrireducens TaxID=46201 RepID=UPI00224767E4|nr:phosphate signaling complex protein PhoU [Geovibrio ferrireducens]MCD8568722.1 phosphate signaling complex protein PhoU [Geovibrio sp.]
MNNAEIQYTALKENLNRLTGLVSGIVEDVSVLLNGYDEELAGKIVEEGKTALRLEGESSKVCISLLGLFEPKANDLRYVIASLNIVGELEAIAGYCTDIAKEVLRAGGPLYEFDMKRFPKMIRETANMIKDSIDSFYKCDAKLALEIIERDDRVDRLHRKILKKAVENMAAFGDRADKTVSFIFITRCLERAADHAVTIAEHSYYYATGKVIKNVPDGEIKADK